MMAARILIVHDEKRRQAEMKEALAHAHTVTLADDAFEAMNLLKQFEDAHLDGVPLDLIVSCVHIDSKEQMTVFDLLKWTKGNPQIRDVPFILICSEPSSMARSLIDSVRLAGHSLGATAYMIMDTFEPEAFLSQIEYYLPERLRSLSKAEHELEKDAMAATPDGRAEDGKYPVSEQEAIEARQVILQEKAAG
jgi:CheY-like chemotaxis protein